MLAALADWKAGGIAQNVVQFVSGFCSPDSVVQGGGICTETCSRVDPSSISGRSGGTLCGSVKPHSKRWS